MGRRGTKFGVLTAACCQLPTAHFCRLPTAALSAFRLRCGLATRALSTRFCSAPGRAPAQALAGKIAIVASEAALAAAAFFQGAYERQPRRRGDHAVEELGLDASGSSVRKMPEPCGLPLSCAAMSCRRVVCECDDGTHDVHGDN